MDNKNNVKTMLKQVYLINTDLKMSKGKIAVQVGHGAIYYMQLVNSHEWDCLTGQSPNHIINLYNRYNDWSLGDMHKIVLKATEEDMKEISKELSSMKIWCRKVHDLGKTQVLPDSFTCLVTEPIEEEIYNKLFKKFKLL